MDKKRGRGGYDKGGRGTHKSGGRGTYNKSIGGRGYGEKGRSDDKFKSYRPPSRGSLYNKFFLL